MSTIANCALCPGWYFASGFSTGGDDFPERDRESLETRYWWACVPAYVYQEAMRLEPQLVYACEWCWYDRCRAILGEKWIVWRDTKAPWEWIIWEWNLPAPSGFGWRSDWSSWWHNNRRDLKAWWDSL